MNGSAVSVDGRGCDTVNDTEPVLALPVVVHIMLMTCDVPGYWRQITMTED